MRNRPWLKWLLIGGGVAIVLAVAGPFIYFNFIQDDAPDAFSLDDVQTDTTTSTSASASDTTVAGGEDGVDGSWTIAAGSEAGYRATEVLFGQTGEAAGRTSDVTGSFDITDTTVEKGSFSVALANVASGQSLRDSQFQGRIMEVSTYPTVEFALTEPIEFDRVPAVGSQITASATGDLTIKATTKSVTFDVNATRTENGQIAVQGSIPITWAEWGIGAPSGGPAQVEDSGVIEFLLVFER
jgi:polyisoprenoid-binding protein YceI